MATIIHTINPQWEPQTRQLRSALAIAHSAAAQTAELALHLETEYDPGFRLGDDVVLVYGCLAWDDIVDAQVLLDCDIPEGNPEEASSVLWRLAHIQGWDGTAKSTIAVLRGDEWANVVCDVRRAHDMSQVAISTSKAMMKGEAK